MRLTPTLWLTLALSLVMIGLGAAQGVTETLFEINREAVISGGQYWRILTGHWVHYGPYHLAMNLGAFMLCAWILFPAFPLHHYAALLTACLLGVGLGVVWFSPGLDYYAGLSGVLHGLLAAGLVLTFSQTPRLNALALAVLAFKIGREQWPGYDTAHALLPVPVAVDAHLYGVVTGLVWGLAVLVWRFHKSRPAP